MTGAGRSGPGAASWALLRETDVEGLRGLTGGEHAHNPAELLASHRFEVLISWLEAQADVVILDSPPVLAVTDASLLASQVDGSVLVIDAGETRRPAAVRAVERLHDVGANVLGVVLNRLAPSSDGYYYYYYHGGYYGGEDGRSPEPAGWLARLVGRGRPGAGGERRRARTADEGEGQTHA